MNKLPKYLSKTIKLIKKPSQLKKIVKFHKWEDGSLELKYADKDQYLELMDKYYNFKETHEDDTETIAEFLEDILEENPLLFDPLRELAEIPLLFDMDEITSAILIFYYEIYKIILPKNFEIGINLIPWVILENRPLLRFLVSHALTLESLYGPLASQGYFEEILALNPNDNQGVRSILATNYLKTNNSKKFLKLEKDYADDISVELNVGKVLAYYRLGELDKARKVLKKQKKYKEHVVKELLKKKHVEPKDSSPWSVTIGGADEAFYYWEQQGEEWKKTKGALKWLKSVWSE